MQYLFAHVSSSTYRDSSFLDHRTSPAPTEVKGADINIINRLLNSNSRPANYIFHSAFCCSTLFANCLQTVSDSLVLKEPLILLHLADALAHSKNSGNFIRRHWWALLRPSLLLLEKKYSGQQGVIIKPANSANNMLEDILSLRPTKTLFMYGSLRDFLLSNLKRLEESRYMVPLFLKRLYPITDYAEKLNIPDVQNLEHLKQCAVLWHTQIYHFYLVAAASGNDSVRCLAASDFLEEPESIVRQALDYFGLACDTERLNQLAKNGPLSRHSKSGDGYDTDERSDENAALSVQHESALHSTLEWMDGLLNKLPVNPPLQPQL
ncbi:MAG: hypothetical protein OEU90_00515 [Gammaproteobacteria bacterium]|nr:hypothetical protein [Gammaproteobacteria bacterium]MDH3750611.1 hypothetical protein [Gammaproteobacteria bacterium]MDH3803930.1 hypothetical protein [Gammaproteobacteria bacterium]